MNNIGLNSGYTKMDLITAAFNEIGFANYLYDIDAAQLDRVLLQLDSMMGTWAGMGVNIGYPIVIPPGTSDINQESNLPVTAIEAVYLNLARRICSSFGKTAPPELISSANQAYQAMLSNLSVLPDKVFPNTLLSGGGNKRPFNQVFINGSDLLTPTDVI